MNVKQLKLKKKKGETRMCKSSIDVNEKVVYFGGTFDILNWGHIQAFKMCSSKGGYLLVGLNTDELVMSYKKRVPVLPFWQKREILESIEYIHAVIPVNDFSPMLILQEYRIDVFCVGSEWADIHTKEIEYMKNKGGEVVVIPEFEGVIHTSEIKRKLLKEAQEQAQK